MISPDNLTREKFCAFSYLARTDFAVNKDGTRKKSLIIDDDLNAAAAAKVLKWVNNNGTATTTKPREMTVEELEVDEFDQAVYVYQASRALGICHILRGESFPRHIYNYVKQTPLRADEFAMVIELLAFDVGLCKTAKHCTLFTCAKYGAESLPDMVGIATYCEENGFWEEMEAITKQIQEGMAKQKKEDEKEAARGKKLRF